MPFFWRSSTSWLLAGSPSCQRCEVTPGSVRNQALSFSGLNVPGAPWKPGTWRSTDPVACAQKDLLAAPFPSAARIAMSATSRVTATLSSATQ